MTWYLIFYEVLSCFGAVMSKRYRSFCDFIIDDAETLINKPWWMIISALYGLSIIDWWSISLPGLSLFRRAQLVHSGMICRSISGKPKCMGSIRYPPSRAPLPAADFSVEIKTAQNGSCGKEAEEGRLERALFVTSWHCFNIYRRQVHRQKRYQ